MASIGHVAVGLAAARAYGGNRRPPSWRSMIGWSALSLLPDADVIGFSFGIRYGDPWGHRGATHSLAMAVAAGLVVGLAARSFGRPFRRTALSAILVLASHGLLDTLTDGGLGCALLWPFDLTRYFAPWRPIPVAPIGLRFLSSYGLIVSATELALFAPLLLYAFWPARPGHPPRR
jgi:inner membrane protein